MVTANKVGIIDFRLPPRSRWDLPSSWKLRSGGWYFRIDVRPQIGTELPLYLEQNFRRAQILRIVYLFTVW